MVEVPRAGADPEALNRSASRVMSTRCRLTSPYSGLRCRWSAAGWEQVADKALEWALAHAQAGRPATTGSPEPQPPTSAAIVPPSSYAASVSALGHVTHHLEHVVPLLPAERPGDRQHRPDRPGRVVATVHVEPERPPRGRPSRRRAAAVVGQRAADLEEGRVEDVLHRPAHVAEVRGRAEHVAVGRQQVLVVGLAAGEGEGLHDADLDLLDGVVVGAGDHRVGELGERPRGGVMDDESRGMRR